MRRLVSSPLAPTGLPNDTVARFISPLPPVSTDSYYITNRLLIFSRESPSETRSEGGGQAGFEEYLQTKVIATAVQ
jgi:hypothetical protein